MQILHAEYYNFNALFSQLLMIGRCGLLILFLILFKASFSQESSTDTLNHPLQQEELKNGPYYQLQAKRASSPAQALIHLKKALSLRSPDQDDNWVAGVRVNMASAYFSLGQTKLAFSELLTAEVLYKKTANISGRVEVLTIMAGFHQRNQSLAQAEIYYKQAIQLHESSGNLHDAANIALNLADLSIRNKNLRSALNHLLYAKKQFDAANDNTGVANSYVRIAEVYRLQKNFSKGEQLILKSALPLYRSTGYKAGRIDCFDVLGKIYHNQKRYSEAKWFFIQENTQARALNDKEGIINSLINLGNVKVDIGDYNLAVRDFKEAETLAKNKGDLFLMARVKQSYAALYKKTGNKEGAKKAYIGSEMLSDSLEDYFIAQAESVKTASAKPDLVQVRKANLKSNKAPENDRFLIVKISATVFLILAILLIILNRIK